MNRAPHNVRLILLPGLGTDTRLFDGLRRRLGPIETPPWLPHRDGESLRDYALRWAEQIPRDGRPLVLGGSSMGGMIAQEMAGPLRPRAVVLIDSSRTGLQPAADQRVIYRMLRHMPAGAFRVAGWISRGFVGKWNQVPRNKQQLFRNMMRRTDPRLIRWAAGAVMAWPGPAEPPPCPVRHIHGQCDGLIPIDQVDPDRVLPDAGHLLNLSHPDAVAEFIRETIVACAGEKSGDSSQSPPPPPLSSPSFLLHSQFAITSAPG